ncbi:MAG: MFS transporter [Clostridia bacterium]|nr:MFS transporter [Clostridia bacterium]
MSDFNIILITMLGLFAAVMFFPLINIVIKKINNRLSNVIGAFCYLIAIILFCFCNTIYGFVIAQAIYNMSSQFKQSAIVILKNNLKAQGKEKDFVKISSYGWLGYSITTAVIAMLSGICFNTNPYLPIILSAIGAVVAVVLSLLFTDVKNEEIQPKIEPSQTKLIKNKLIVLLLLMNIITVGCYIFLQTKTTLLIQEVCENININLAEISIIISVVIFISRLFRIAANILTPYVYKKVKNKPNILLGIGVLLIISGLCFALGGNIKANLYINISLIAIGLFIIISIRDLYLIIENKIIINNFNETQQKQVLVLANFFSKIGKLVVNGLALLIMCVFTLNLVYLAMFVVLILQMFITVPLSKYLKNIE